MVEQQAMKKASTVTRRVLLPVSAVVAILGVAAVAAITNSGSDERPTKISASAPRHDPGKPETKPDRNEPDPNIHEPITTRDQAIALSTRNPNRIESITRAEAKLTKFGVVEKSLAVLNGRTRKGEAAIDADKSVWVVAVSGKVFPNGPADAEPNGGQYPWFLEIYDAEAGTILGIIAGPVGVWPVGFDAIVDEALGR